MTAAGLFVDHANLADLVKLVYKSTLLTSLTSSIPAEGLVEHDIGDPIEFVQSARLNDLFGHVEPVDRVDLVDLVNLVDSVTSPASRP